MSHVLDVLEASDNEETFALHQTGSGYRMLHGSRGSKVVPLSVQHQGGGKMKAFWIDDSGGEHTVAGHPNRMTKVK